MQLNLTLVRAAQNQVIGIYTIALDGALGQQQHAEWNQLFQSIQSQMR